MNDKFVAIQLEGLTWISVVPTRKVFRSGCDLHRLPKLREVKSSLTGPLRRVPIGTWQIDCWTKRIVRARNGRI